MNQHEIRQKRLAALERASQGPSHPLIGPEHICIETPLRSPPNGASFCSSSQPDIVTVNTTSTYNTPSSDTHPCSGARSRAPPSASSRSSEPSYTSRGSRGPHSASSASAPSRGGITTLSDLPSSRDTGGSCKTRVSSRTVTQTQNLELYVRLPSRRITGEQLEEVVRVRYGVEIRVRHMNNKFQNHQFGNDRNFCFVECLSRKDLEYLVREMNDTTIGDWEDPIMVKEKQEHPKEG